MPDADDAGPRGERSEPLQLVGSNRVLRIIGTSSDGLKISAIAVPSWGATCAMYSTACTPPAPGICIMMTVGLPGM